MPIRPEQKALYPDNWKAISTDIRQNRADHRCECRGECGYDHAAEMADFDLEFGNADLIEDHERCAAFNGSVHPITDSRVVLTVAHLDHDPTNNDRENLRALCQRCHNKYDAAHRQETQRRRRAVRDLFD